MNKLSGVTFGSVQFTQVISIISILDMQVLIVQALGNTKLNMQKNNVQGK